MYSVLMCLRSLMVPICQQVSLIMFVNMGGASASSMEMEWWNTSNFVIPLGGL
ncbi:hypothetical protein A2U01_0107984, partial [Trifolium medium]|nr:hypothetical protein [Trifolium medium]